MAKTGRVVLAVVAGAVVWAALWVGGTMAAQAAIPSIPPAGQPVADPGILLGLIAYSVALSILAGYVTARVAAADAGRAVGALAVLQLVIGIGVEASAWSLTPVWYHVIFLLLIVPATLYGGRLAVRRAPSPVSKGSNVSVPVAMSTVPRTPTAPAAGGGGPPTGG